jgi:hypothetical protein
MRAAETIVDKKEQASQAKQETERRDGIFVEVQLCYHPWLFL